MKCVECEGEEAELAEMTEDVRFIIRCKGCGFHWEHKSSSENASVGKSGGQRHHCPVCPYVFKDQGAPIITIGTPSKAGHRCDRTKSFQMGITYGADPAALDRRLAELDEGALQEWPRVLEMKQERLGKS